MQNRVISEGHKVGELVQENNYHGSLINDKERMCPKVCSFYGFELFEVVIFEAEITVTVEWYGI